MMNNSIYCDSCIKEIIALHSCEVRHLSFYSPNFNLIELSFSVLKAWVRRHFHEIWSSFEGSFDELLHYAVTRSRCDRVPKQHSKHSVDKYIFEANIRTLERELTETGNIEF
jgi:transposase